MPKVSIGLPCYNEAPYIEETLRSVLGQTETDLEIIICDNASTDGTTDIIRRVIAGDSRATLHVAETNIGGPRNFERAWQLATSPHFMWMGAHDVLHTDYVKKLRLLLESDPTCVLAFAESIYIAKAGGEIPGETREVGPDCSSHDVRERMRAMVWDLRRCDLFHGLMRREEVPVHLIGSCRSPDMVILAALALKGRFLRAPQLLFFRRKNREQETEDDWQTRLRSQGYSIAEGQSVASSMETVRTEFYKLIESHPDRSVLKTIIAMGFKERHHVPWDASEAATWWERLRFRDHETLQREVEQRLQRELRPTNEESRRRMERELNHLLKENHKLRKARRK